MKTVRTADLDAKTAAIILDSLNPEVEYLPINPFDLTDDVIVTDIDPEELLFPEGWYYAKGSFRNKHNTMNGFYEEIPVLKRDGTSW